MFARWFGFREIDISEMYFDEVLDFCNGVMLFESLESSRGSIPMTDTSGMIQFQARIEKQLDEIWDLMFPKSITYFLEKERKIQEFKDRSGMYRALARKITKERGG